jgi:DNA-binding NarL/FixJ family response regulator
VVEIDKCILLCVNCHAQEHFDSQRFNLYKQDIIKKEEDISQFKIDYTKKNIDKDVVKLYKKGLSVLQIALTLKVSRNPVKRILAKLNLPTKKYKSKVSVSKEQLLNFLSKGITNKSEMARQLGCSNKAIHDAFTRYELR